METIITNEFFMEFSFIISINKLHNIILKCQRYKFELQDTVLSFTYQENMVELRNKVMDLVSARRVATFKYV